MRYLQTFSLFENVAIDEAIDTELSKAIFKSKPGRDLLALVHFLGPSRTHIRKTEATFNSREVAKLGERRFVAIEPVTRSKNSPRVWSYVFRSFAMSGPSPQKGPDFPTVEDCLRGLWVDLVTSLCDEIFDNQKERTEHASLIKANLKLIEGYKYGVEDIIFIITNLKGITEGRVEPNMASTLRKKFPHIWKSMGVDKNDGLETVADLGELGF